MLRTLLLLICLLCSSACDTFSKESKDSADAMRLHFLSGLSGILGVPQNQVRDAKFIKDHFRSVFGTNASKQDVRAKVRVWFSAPPEGFSIELPNDGDEVDVIYKSSAGTMKAIFLFKYDRAENYRDVLYSIVTFGASEEAQMPH